MQSLETAEQYSWKVHTANRQLWFLSKLPKGHECVCIVHVCIFMLPVVCAHMCYCVVHVCMLCSCGVCVWYMAACVLSVVCAHVCIVWCMCVWCSHGVCVCVCVRRALGRSWQEWVTGTAIGHPSPYIFRVCGNRSVETGEKFYQLKNQYFFPWEE